MNIIRTLQKWGNSTGVRLPRQVMEEAQLYADQKVSITVREGSVVLTPITEEPLTLERMLSGATPQLVGGELDWGPDVGAEVYE